MKLATALLIGMPIAAGIGWLIADVRERRRRARRQPPLVVDQAALQRAFDARPAIEEVLAMEQEALRRAQQDALNREFFGEGKP